MAYIQANYSAACARYAQSFALRRELRDQWGITISLGYVGAAAVALGQVADGISLLGASDALLATFQVVPEATDVIPNGQVRA